MQSGANGKDRYDGATQNAGLEACWTFGRTVVQAGLNVVADGY